MTAGVATAAGKLRAAVRTLRASETPTEFELAVAAWLEETAAQADTLARLAVEFGDRSDAYAPAYALAVARAVLIPDRVP